MLLSAVEHVQVNMGVGIGKQKYQEKEHGAALLVMKKMKQALDPKNILNPNKIFKIKE